ncbi:gamma-glutamylcyclotransferase family protein [Alkalimarinus alittae]|uniref:Gamma-glutamylcyclotransferase family protein n=1 Tax=Alkalimarinus alittae TaxID=2961619 RepID=A0ABY6N5K5_9ALTE|nr:gamma-glutamylcyclotransferase family protein [Alkalimarinus alittae]UZE97290.1 gamma-glutamylcyclotransferase [Alkalimarinus alittae]
MKGNDFLVFVYGTLRKGESNDALLQEAESLGFYETESEYTMFDLGYFPAVTPSGKTSISGELYRVDQQTAKNLDQLEGYPSYYDRIQITTPMGDAWIYVIHHLTEDYDEVEKGDWVKYCARKDAQGVRNGYRHRG